MKTRAWVLPVFLPPVVSHSRLIDPPLRAAPASRAEWRERALAGAGETLRRRPGKAQLGFFGASFGAQNAEWRAEALSLAAALKGRIESLRVTLEPHDVSPSLLDELWAAKVRTVELDVGAFDDEALSTCDLPWRSGDAAVALAALQKRGFATGVILRPGMPGGTPAEVLRTARRAVELRPAFVRIYPVLVLAGTPLAAAFESRLYRPLSLDEAIEFCGEMLRLFGEAGIAVSRIGLQPAVDLDGGATVIAGPWHPSLRALAESPLWLERASKLISAHFRFQKELTLIVAPRDESRVRGPQGAIVKRLREKFRLEKLQVRVDAALDEGSLALEWSDPAEGLKRVAG